MEDELRYEFPCRMGMLAAAVLHWVAAGIMLLDRFAPAGSSDYTTRALAHLASALPRQMSLAAQ